MRVIGGEFRGRRLRAPRGITTRPTSDRVRESLFDILAPRVRGASVLDAYAGTGAVGIEALSRGADSCVFVESDRAAARIVAENIAALGLERRSTVVIRPFAEASASLAREGRAFDLIYLDPPYGAGELLRALRLCAGGGLLRPGGRLIAEHDARLATPEREDPLRLDREVRYGGTRLSFYAVDTGSDGS